MSLTPTNTETSALAAPDKVVQVISSGAPDSDGSWTQLKPRTLYTAPASVSYSQIYFPLAADGSYASSVEGNTSYGFIFQVLTSKGFVRHILNTKNASDVGFNNIQYFSGLSGGYPDFITTFKWGDVYVNWRQSSYYKHFILPADIFTLGPGDSFQIGTTSNNNNQDIALKFDVWEYK